MDVEEFNNIVKKPGYGIHSAFGKGMRSTLKRPVDAKVRDAGEGSDVERSDGCPSVQPEKNTINYSGQCTLRIKVFRRRLCDPDGNCTKYHIDFLRYIGALKDDNAKEIRIIFDGQEKVATEAEERCEISVEYPEVDFENLWVKEKPQQ